MEADVLARARAVVDGLREAEGKATPGPWREKQEGDDRFDPYIWAPVPKFGEDFVISSEGDHDPADVAAIVALRNATPALLACAEFVLAIVDEEGVALPSEGVSACSTCEEWNDTGEHAPGCPWGKGLAARSALAALVSTEPTP